MTLKEQLLELKSYDAISNLLMDKTLTSWQSTTILLALENKSALISHMTGMGKTAIAVGIMRLLRNKHPQAKFIFVGTSRQKMQTAEEFSVSAGFKTTYLDASDLSVRKANALTFLSSDILFLTQEALNRLEIMDKVSEHLDRYLAIFGDEAHLFGNFREASSAWMFNCLCRRFEYRFALTATPMTSAASQVSDLCYTMDWETFPDPNQLKNRLLGGEVLKENYPNFYLSLERKDLGIQNEYNVVPIFVEPTSEQRGLFGKELFKKTRGPGAIPQHKALVDTIIKLKSEGKKGLVFIHHHEYRKAFLDYLESRKDAAIRVDSINGLVSRGKTDLIQKQFNAGDLDVVITSIPQSLNLDCDYIFLYEFTADVRQMIGRGERGFVQKKLDIYTLFTKDTGEATYYVNVIWGRAVFNQEVLSKDYDFLIKLGEALDLMGMVDREQLNIKG